jgi:hypothetical protein
VLYVPYDMEPGDMVVDSCEGWTAGSCCLSESSCTCDTNIGCRASDTEVPFCTNDKLTCDISLGEHQVADCRIGGL